MPHGALFLLLVLREIVWVGFAQILSELRKHSGQDLHAGQDLQVEALLVVQTVGSSLDDTDFVVQSLDEAERDFVARIEVGGDAVPVSVDDLGELLVGLEALPFQLRLPALEEIPRPRRAARVLHLPERLLHQICGIEPFVGHE